MYKHAQQLMTADPVNSGAVKRDLHHYLKLDVESPSVLHACFLHKAIERFPDNVCGR